MAEHYRALTRKYRPRTFDDIVSQDHVSGTLKNAIDNGRLSHAYMFCGPRGVGKTTMARVLARTINQIDDTVDGEHLNQTLNVVEIDAASNNKVEDVHHLRESVRIPPQNGRYKVFIVDEVHMLSKQAFNALLKTLEEPPDHAIFIFATTEPHKVLPTILSRVQRFDFKRIKVDEIVPRLKKISAEEGIQIDDESLHVIAKKADGALRDALGLMDQAIAFCGTNITRDALLKALNVVSSDRLFQFMETVEQEDSAAGLHLIHELLQEGYDIQEFLVELTEHLRNVYVAVTADQLHLIEASQEMKKRYKAVADRYTEEDLMRMLHLVNEAQYKIREAHQPKLQFELTLLKLIHMKRAKKLDHLMREMQALKKNAKNGVLNAEVPEVSTTSESKASTTTAPTQSETKSTPEKERSGASTSAQVEAKTETVETKPDADASADEDSGETTNAQPEPSEQPPQKQETQVDQAREVPEREPEPEPQPVTENEPDPDAMDEKPQAEDENRQEVAPDRSKADVASSPSAPAAASNQSDSETEVSSGSSKMDDQDDYDFFGQPSLGNGSLNGTASTSTHGKESASAATTVDNKDEGSTSEPQVQTSNEPLQFSTVQERWSNFVDQAKGDVPQMLYYQLQRVHPLDLKKDTLVLKCGDHFAQTMLEDNRLELSRLISRFYGKNLRMESQVEEQKKEPTETMSPYERFKQLQQKDPTIRTLVDLFGAELEY
ncbi:MAG: DNA polymerase III subunit gamma/tau [Bacteroidota bacterium]